MRTNGEDTDLKGYLETLNNDYIFYDSATKDIQSYTLEPIYFDSLDEAKIFLNSVDKFKNQVISSAAPVFVHDYDDDSGTNGEDYYKTTFYMGGLGVSYEHRVKSLGSK